MVQEAAQATISPRARGRVLLAQRSTRAHTGEHSGSPPAAVEHQRTTRAPGARRSRRPQQGPAVRARHLARGLASEIAQLYVGRVADPVRIPPRERWRRIIFEHDTPAGKAFDVLLIVMILASVLVVMLDSL